MEPYQKKTYTQSDRVTQAQKAWEEQSSAKPQAYRSPWQDQLDEALDKIVSRPGFSYDLQADPLYRQYRDQYVREGKLAMMDTMGRAALLTGGYANSYAQTAGQQTYQNHLQKLSDRIPEFYGMALEGYQSQGQALKDRYQLLHDREDTDYSRYLEELDRWDQETRQLYEQYLQERSFDYDRYTDETDFAYSQYRDSVTDQQWQDSFDYQKQQNQLAYEQWLQEFEYQKQQDQLDYDRWLQEFQEDQRRYEQNRADKASRGSGGGSGGSKADSQDVQTARAFVENMLNSATSSRFDPERVISSTSALTDEQKKEAQSYLKTVLEAGRMK